MKESVFIRRREINQFFKLSLDSLECSVPLIIGPAGQGHVTMSIIKIGGSTKWFPEIERA